jgi:hypothetical protein
MIRVYTKIGNVFSAVLDENTKKYFHLVAYDLTQLNSDVIKVFKTKYPVDEKPDLSSVVKDEADFYTHCVTKFGVKLGYWEKVGNVPNVGAIDVLFRDTNDAGSKPGEQIKLSQNWYVWKINEEFHRVGKLKGENRKAEIGVIVTPSDVIQRMKTGKYDFFYPDFE